MSIYLSVIIVGYKAIYTSFGQMATLIGERDISSN